MAETDTRESDPDVPKLSVESSQKLEVPVFSGFQPFPNADATFPAMYPLLMPGLVPLQNQEQVDQGPGLYVVPVNSSMGTMAGFPSHGLVPLTYNIPVRSRPTGVAGAEHGQQAREQQGPQRQVFVRRFQFAIQLDLFLILKLVAVVILFNQDGSRQRLMTLLFFASLVYLHQTGALAPLLRWLRHQASVPQPRPAIRVVNDQNRNALLPEEHPGAENQNQPVENGDRLVENENQAEAAGGNGVNWWGIAKEIQMFIIGFVTSLFPGFHHHND